ncbi:Short-chain dehydrogenase [Phytophthora palmivora]|uniref:Short-chain dehydrogenase n=1 Tax=Phytophthora palmivora TaxID=4796 RepID=A0A2P4YD39_9STRA|nr:Short-chain dehydrogenase [Phytophthora palmivora]
MQYHHPLFQHSIFKSDMFTAFRDDLIQRVSTTPQPENVLLQQAIPIVSEDIRELRTSTARLFQHINTCFERLTSDIKDNTRSQQLELQLRFGETLVEMAWQEYSVGIPPNPSVKMMEKTFGTLWRKNNTDTQFYYRRKPIYDVIELVKSEEAGVAEHEIVEYFEFHRQRMKLRKFSRKLNVALTSYKIQDNQISFRQYFDKM